MTLKSFLLALIGGIFGGALAKLSNGQSSPNVFRPKDLIKVEVYPYLMPIKQNIFSQFSSDQESLEMVKYD